jgi:hypothetical protein
MNFVRDGYPWMALSGSIAIAVLATAVWRRSWSIWLLGFALLVVAAGVAWMFRMPVPLAHRTATLGATGIVVASVGVVSSAGRRSRTSPRAAAWAR